MIQKMLIQMNTRNKATINQKNKCKINKSDGPHCYQNGKLAVSRKKSLTNGTLNKPQKVSQIMNRMPSLLKQWLIKRVVNNEVQHCSKSQVQAQKTNKKATRSI